MMQPTMQRLLLLSLSGTVHGAAYGHGARTLRLPPTPTGDDLKALKADGMITLWVKMP